MKLRSGIWVPLRVDHRAVGRVEVLRQDVAGNADNFQGASPEITERLAERVSVGPELTGEFLRNNNWTGANSPRWIAAAERATAYDRNPQRVKEIRRHPVHRRLARCMSWDLNFEQTPVVKQPPAGVSDRSYSRQSFETRRENTATGGPGPLLCRSVTHIHLRKEHMPRFKPGVGAGHFLNIVNSQPGAEKQNETQRNLGPDQKSSYPGASAKRTLAAFERV